MNIETKDFALALEASESTCYPNGALAIEAWEDDGGWAGIIWAVPLEGEGAACPDSIADWGEPEQLERFYGPDPISFHDELRRCGYEAGTWSTQNFEGEPLHYLIAVPAETTEA